MSSIVNKSKVSLHRAMKVMVPPSQNGLGVSTARNVKAPVTDRPWSSHRHMFRFLSKTYFLSYADLGGRHDHRIDYATIVTLIK